MKYIFFLLVFCFSAHATENPGPFKINEVYMAHPANFHFRVISDNPEAWHCHNGPKNPAWSFVNEAAPGSKGMMSALLAAYVSNKTVTLVTLGVDTYAGRMCQIVELKISQ
ncbi:hypothetical protein A1OO_19380 [Enterovibrio norvegicus FF-33]|uniref:hypothetical protein n=1 Tax=Enterovibrio norvegicus TaxID=188144 RepID=UPI0003804139|nr:hypothetical protein [Enterovibrio norvegicus]OEE67901.1 hypothetical protein A1OO_19380 [Enterovibrio norvegicus FF-33]